MQLTIKSISCETEGCIGYRAFAKEAWELGRVKLDWRCDHCGSVNLIPYPPEMGRDERLRKILVLGVSD